MRNKKGLKDLLNLTKDFKTGAIGAPEYFKHAREIIGSYIALYYYPSEYDLILDALEVVFNNRKDILENRILIDLCIEEQNLTIKQIN